MPPVGLEPKISAGEWPDISSLRVNDLTNIVGPQNTICGPEYRSRYSEWQLAGRSGNVILVGDEIFRDPFRPALDPHSLPAQWVLGLSPGWIGGAGR